MRGLQLTDHVLFVTVCRHHMSRPDRESPGGRLHDSQAAFDKDLSGIRAAAERAVASVETWRIFSEEGARSRLRITARFQCLFL